MLDEIARSVPLFVIGTSPIRTGVSEQREYMRLTCEWNDASRTLTLRRDPNGRQGIGRELQLHLVTTEENRALTLERDVSRIRI